MRFAAMGTRVELHRFAGGDADALAAAEQAIRRVDDALTIHRPSPATALNAALLAGGDAAIDDPILFEAIVAAADAHVETLGLFDVAADPRSGANWSMVAFDRPRGRIAAERPLAFDFGGLGKGIALDHALAALRAGGVVSALATLGESSVGVLGEHPLGGAWPFAIPHPLDPDAVLVTVQLQDQALSVSATVGAGARAPGRAAMIRPADGRIVDAPSSAIAVSSSGTRAEAMSTALIVADVAQAARLLDGAAGTRFRFNLEPVGSAPDFRMPKFRMYT